MEALAVVGAAVGLPSALVFLVFHVLHRRAQKIVDEMQLVPTRTAGQICAMCDGGYQGLADIEGDVSCDQPIRSLAAGVPCCAFNAKVEQENMKTETRYETDSQGHTQSRTETHWEWDTIFQQAGGTRFTITDGTGSVIVDPKSADFIYADTLRQDTIRHSEPWFESVTGGPATNSYRVTEEGLLPSGRAYVRGWASQGDGGTIIALPPDKSHFLLSRKGESELSQQYAGYARTFLIVKRVGIVGIGVGLACLLGALIAVMV